MQNADRKPESIIILQTKQPFLLKMVPSLKL